MVDLAIEDLTFTYAGASKAALRGIDLVIPGGAFLCLCGQSGCGKTTLLRHLKSVLTPRGTTTGRVLFQGRPLDEISEWDQSALIGFVMQDPEAQIVTDKVWHELAFGLENLGTDPRAMGLRIAEMATFFGIQDWFSKDISDLSGGQRQLLNLASVIAMHPHVLILDEPTSQLDPIAATDFLSMVHRINEELGVTVLMTEHRLEEVYAMADTVCVMEEGSIIAQGTPRDVAGALYGMDSPMTYALPSPICIFHGVTGAIRTGEDAEDALGEGGEDASSRSDSPRVDSDGRPSSESRCGTRLVDTSSPPFEAPSKAACPLTVRKGRTWLKGWLGEHPLGRTALPVGSLPEPEGNCALALKGVWFRYEREAPDILKDVDLAVPQGMLYALCGANGVGKSTLLRCASGTLRPYRGQIRVFGKRIESYRDGSLHRGCVAMLPQDPKRLFVTMTVREELEEMVDGLPLDAANRKQRVTDMARLCALSSLMDSHPLDLSGGEQQRVALGKALLTDPRLLLLDEPTKGIDSLFKRELARIFDGLKQNGVTIVMVSHDIEFCARYADAVSLFFDGAIVSTDTARGFFAQNSFYTTAANRMSRGILANAVTDEDVIGLCLGHR